jgi:hypothetical protein
MKFSKTVFFAGVLGATAVSAFQSTATSKSVGVMQQPKQRTVGIRPLFSTMMGTIDATEQAQRDVYPLQQWAEQYGAQSAPGVELTTQDGVDWFLMTNQNIGAGQPVLFVPNDIILSSFKVEQEFGGNLMSAEQALMQYEGTAQRLPLFRLMVKILVEYEKGQDSPYFTWLNALPRQFFNGAAMTGESDLYGISCLWVGKSHKL